MSFRTYWVLKKHGLYISGFKPDGTIEHSIYKEKAHRFKSLDEAMPYVNQYSYVAMKEYY